jgi:hypothetical protein
MSGGGDTSASDPVAIISDRRMPIALAMSAVSGACNSRGSPNEFHACASLARYRAKPTGQAASGPAICATTRVFGSPEIVSTPPRGVASPASRTIFNISRAIGGGKTTPSAKPSRSNCNLWLPAMPGICSRSASAPIGSKTPPQAARSKRSLSVSSRAVLAASTTSSTGRPGVSAASSRSPWSDPSNPLRSWLNLAHTNSASCIGLAIAARTPCARRSVRLTRATNPGRY